MRTALYERADPCSLLSEGRTCWKASTATRATLLIDGDEYFCALRATLLKARRQILIAGWDLDTRIMLPASGCAAGTDEAPLELGDLLGFLVATRPGLEIHVLRWDHHAIYSRDRQSDTGPRLARRGIHFHSDAAHPVTGCVHHKIVVVDDAIAFCGGIDLTHQRWDRRGHEPDETARRDHLGHQYAPTHDTQLCVTGPVARLLSDYIRACWCISAGKYPRRVQQASDLWPDGVRVDFRDVRTAIARTLPPRGGCAGVREVEDLYLAAIADARDELYIENQYFTSTRIAGALAAQFDRNPGLQGLLVGSRRPRTWIEHHTMGHGRMRFQQVLQAAGVTDRLPLLAALNRAGQGIIVHSKIAFFDDRLFTVGSANLNRRSMGFDVECNLALEAQTDAQRRALRSLRNRLIGEHLDLEQQEIEPALSRYGLAQLPQAVHRGRRLVPVDRYDRGLNLGPMLAPIFDREDVRPAFLSRAQVQSTPKWQHALLRIWQAATDQ